MDENRKTDLDTKWKKVAIQAVTNHSFKKKLVKDPMTILNEQGLSLPQGVEARFASGDTEISLFIPPNATPEIEQEVKWWKRRLDMIRQFGLDDDEQKPLDFIPDSTGEDV